jgi:hypothetical protein
MPSHSTGTVHRPSIELAVVCFFRAAAAAAAPVRPGPAARTHAHATHCCPASPAFLIQALEPTPNLVLHVPLVSERPGPIVLAIAFAFAFAFDIAIAIAAGSRLRFAVCRCAPACLPACLLCAPSSSFCFTPQPQACPRRHCMLHTHSAFSQANHLNMAR